MTDAEILDAVEVQVRALHNQDRWLAKEKTLPVFRDLGWRLGFKVAAKRCGADFSEWMYDMSWSKYRETDGGSYFVAQPLVLETEGTPDRFVDGDFQKLVQARATVRVWIAKVHPSQSVQDHVDKCKGQIREFPGTQPDDTYIFSIYDKDKSAAHFERFSPRDMS